MSVRHFFNLTLVVISVHSQMLVPFPLGVKKLVLTSQGGFVVTKP